jgi:formate dehydrogenase major subunit
MSDKITFTLDGREVEAEPGETIWQVAQRNGTKIPHMCWPPAPGYGPHANRRACMVEVEGERAGRILPEKGHRRHEGEVGERAAKKSRQMVFELLTPTSPGATSHDPASSSVAGSMP